MSGIGMCRAENKPRLSVSVSLGRGLGRLGSLSLGHCILGCPKSILNLTDTVSDRDMPRGSGSVHP